jgi:hydrogenase/urease accessory protein HupE
LFVCLSIALGAWQATAIAHEVRPGYLEILETAPESYDVSWKVPAVGEFRLAISVRLPASCHGRPTSGSFTGSAFVERWTATCPGGLVGQSIEIDGLMATRTDVLVRMERVDGTTQTERLTPDRVSFEVLAAPSRTQVMKTYFVLGVEHILGGVDHLLFVLVLLFLVGNWRRLIATVTAFTVAHSITLVAATLGYLRVPQAPVEASIALSIVFVAAEVVHGTKDRAGRSANYSWLVAFAFGLLHGLGFASALHSIGLPERDIPLALLFFNLGIELGQLLFIASVVLVLSALAIVVSSKDETARGPWQMETLIRRPVAYGVGSIAAFWVVQRVVAFWQ